MGIIAALIRGIVGPPRPTQCVHCARRYERGDQFVAGPGIYICASCGSDAARRFAVPRSEIAFGTCSFCATTDRAISLGADERHAICRDCADLVHDLVTGADRPGERFTRPPAPPRHP